MDAGNIFNSECCTIWQEKILYVKSITHGMSIVNLYIVRYCYIMQLVGIRKSALQIFSMKQKPISHTSFGTVQVLYHKVSCVTIAEDKICRTFNNILGGSVDNTKMKSFWERRATIKAKIKKN